jgi:hypothetical protein
MICCQNSATRQAIGSIGVACLRIRLLSALVTDYISPHSLESPRKYDTMRVKSQAPAISLREIGMVRVWGCQNPSADRGQLRAGQSEVW